MQLSTKQTVYLRRQELAVIVIHCYIKLLPSTALMPVLSTSPSQLVKLPVLSSRYIIGAHKQVRHFYA